MLIETIAVIALITPISGTSAWSLRNDVERKWHIVLLYAVPNNRCMVSLSIDELA